MKRILILAGLLLGIPASLPISAADDRTHIEKGHLSSAFCKATPDKNPKQVTAIYREIIPVAAPKGTYSTVAFKGGYVGLVLDKDSKAGGDQINFSIWGEDAMEAQSADKKYGTIKTRQFTHEGTGWAGRLAYPWKVGTRYQVFVHVKHEKGQTLFSAWFGSAEKNEWLLAGRIRKNGIHYLGYAGGFIENPGKYSEEDKKIVRSTGYGPAWIHDGQQWLPCTQVEALVKDPENARFFERDNVVYLELGLGNKSDKGNKYTYSIKSPGAEPQQLPEEVSIVR
jgi:hypothetical protein